MHARIITTLGTRNTAGIFLLFHYTARAAAAAAAVTIYYNAAPLLLRSSSAARNTEILRVVAETSRGRGVGAGGGPELWWQERIRVPKPGGLVQQNTNKRPCHATKRDDERQKLYFEKGFLLARPTAKCAASQR
uniref:Putative secreted protein n=1 Tax=Anopheles darlingi TaxID=43151 RepID=A0A2M4DIG6_ANODA